MYKRMNEWNNIKKKNVIIDEFDGDTQGITLDKEQFEPFSLSLIDKHFHFIFTT